MSISKNIVDMTKSYLEKNSYLFQNVPVNIREIVKKEGVVIKEFPFDEEVSGVLVINNGVPTIGIDSSSRGLSRERFTIAHELGHYILHHEKSNVFVDKVFFRKKMDGYTSKEEKIEREANYFAANILMPEDLVRREISDLTCDLHEDDTINKLADRFKVSSSAMLYRLINLNII